MTIRAILGCLLGIAAAAEQDWTQWRGPGRDGVVSAFREPKDWPERLTRRWQVTVGLGHSSPVVAGRRVYLHSRQGEDEVVSSFELETGKLVWADRYPASYQVNPAAAFHGKGPKSTPAASDGRLFTLGISGILSCYDLQTGKLAWRKDF
ncbi:MAG: serine/threonine protein kinase, partial [Acidobacteria bacterium]